MKSVSKMNGDQLTTFDLRSNRSSIGGSVVGSTKSNVIGSTKSKISTLTKEELQKFFKDKKKEMDDEAKSKISKISKGTFKSYRIKKEMAEITEDKTESPKKMEEIDEISYHSGSLDEGEGT